MRPFLIIKTGCTLPSIAAEQGDFVEWFLAGTGIEPSQSQVVSVCDDEQLPPPEEVRGALITGSPAMVSDREAWSERTAAWLRGAARGDLPLLGVCYGHQLLAHALGGTVGPCRGGAEVGSAAVTLTARGADDALLGALPRTFHAQVTHWESVLELPPGATRLATTAQDDNHAFRHGACAWGVQFHPEFSAEVMRGYIDKRGDKIQAAGQDPKAAMAGVRDTPEAASVLKRFASLLNAG